MTTRQRRRRLARRHGRPPQATAQRRQTTLAGRRAPDDQGTPQLRAKKRAVTLRENLEIDPSAALFGHDSRHTLPMAADISAGVGRDGECQRIMDGDYRQPDIDRSGHSEP
jgi:hypothetical protein